MRKNTALRLSGFIGTTCLALVLAGAAVSGTSAYFTDSKSGQLNATTGHIKLTTSQTTFSLTGLNPGEDRLVNVSYKVDTTGTSDVWLVFDPTTAGYQSLTGSDGQGRFGHVKVGNSGVQFFESYNLKSAPATAAADASCGVNSDGHGGSAAKATSDIDNPPYCAVPTAIKLASGVKNGGSGTLNLTYGLTNKVKAQDTVYVAVPFTVVATQAGVRPDAIGF